MNRRLAQRALLGCGGFSVAAPLLAATVTWDDGATTPPQLPGDGISWNDPINWDTDMAPTGVDHVVLTTELIKVQDGNAAFAGSLDAGSTNLVINGALTVGGSFYSNATITIVGEDDSPNSGAGLTIGGGGTLDGTGEIRLRRTQGPGVNPAVFSSSGVNPVIHAAEHTIRGEGFLSANLVNNGLIVAEDLDGNPGSILAL
ncbi:MAG TPA: hypothetical protein PKC18_14200, partial [Lacipirellulaceae bacterium]|nr:hypothetical protein [Lacipirellulaceae bacterium]